MKNESRRLLIKGIWVTPIINTVSLPVHAQTSPDPFIQFESLTLKNDTSNSNNIILSFVVGFYTNGGVEFDIPGGVVIVASGQTTNFPISTFSPLENLVIDNTTNMPIKIIAEVFYQTEIYCLTLDIPNASMSYGVTDLTPLTSSCSTGQMD